MKLELHTALGGEPALEDVALVDVLVAKLAGLGTVCDAGTNRKRGQCRGSLYEGAAKVPKRTAAVKEMATRTEDVALKSQRSVIVALHIRQPIPYCADDFHGKIMASRAGGSRRCADLI
jgi:hypothetical protein